MPRKKGAGSGRGPGYKTEELVFLVDLVADATLIASTKWESVGRAFNQKFKHYPRTWKALKQKFDNLADKDPPTGGTEAPDHVIKAKEAQELINIEMDLRNGSDDDEDDEDDKEEDEEDEENEVNLSIL